MGFSSSDELLLLDPEPLSFAPGDVDDEEDDDELEELANDSGF